MRNRHQPIGIILNNKDALKFVQVLYGHLDFLL